MPQRMQIGISISLVSLAIAACALSSPTNVNSPAQIPDTQVQQRQPDVPYEPTPYPIVTELLKLARVNQNDVVYDLGSGDGRIVITAVKQFGARGVGVEIDPSLIKRSQENARKAGVENRVRFLQQDLFQTNLSDATVVTLFLYPDVNLRLRPKLLQELKPGTRIVSHEHSMGDWKPDRVVTVQGPTRQHLLYYWVVPENIPAHLK